MANTVLTASEQAGFDQRNPSHASSKWLLVPATGVYVKDSVLGIILIAPDPKNPNAVWNALGYYNRQFLKTAQAEIPNATSSSNWWIDFTAALPDAVSVQVSEFAKEAKNYIPSGTSVGVVVAIGIVVFLILYAPRPKG